MLVHEPLSHVNQSFFLGAENHSMHVACVQGLFKSYKVYSAPSKFLAVAPSQSFTFRHVLQSRTMTSSAPRRADPFRPAARVAGQRKDVWSIINEAALLSPVLPIVNMGQGFYGYNPPTFVLDAAKHALDRECIL